MPRCERDGCGREVDEVHSTDEGELCLVCYDAHEERSGRQEVDA